MQNIPDSLKESLLSDTEHQFIGSQTGNGHQFIRKQEGKFIYLESQAIQGTFY
jgi:hypothetical protein